MIALLIFIYIVVFLPLGLLLVFSQFEYSNIKEKHKLAIGIPITLLFSWLIVPLGLTIITLFIFFSEEDVFED